MHLQSKERRLGRAAAADKDVEAGYGEEEGERWSVADGSPWSVAVVAEPSRRAPGDTRTPVEHPFERMNTHLSELEHSTRDPRPIMVIYILD
jgi:hypothetical protein